MLFQRCMRLVGQLAMVALLLVALPLVSTTPAWRK